MLQPSGQMEPDWSNANCAAEKKSQATRKHRPENPCWVQVRPFERAAGSESVPACLQSQHSEGKVRRIVTSSRAARTQDAAIPLEHVPSQAV